MHSLGIQRPTSSAHIHSLQGPQPYVAASTSAADKLDIMYQNGQTPTIFLNMNAAGEQWQPLYMASFAVMSLQQFAMWTIHPTHNTPLGYCGILRKILTCSMNNLTTNIRPRETGKGHQHNRESDGPYWWKWREEEDSPHTHWVVMQGQGLRFYSMYITKQITTSWLVHSEIWGTGRV